MNKAALNRHVTAHMTTHITEAAAETRTVDIGGKRLHLPVRRSARRSLALIVDHRGARLAVPHGVPETVIARFIHDHGPWLLDRLAGQIRPPSLTLADGALFPLLGEPARLRTGGSGRRALWRHGADGAEELYLPLAPSAALPAAVVRALKSRAAAWFRGRVEEYCLRLAPAAPVVPTPAVRLTSAHTRWGSCSRVSGIRLHWRLIHLPPELIDYVVAHEVAHLVEMNHSPRFWAIVGQLHPGWQSARRRLHAAAVTLPVIDERDAFPINLED
jgi:predicted metal-dependent hydrolase